MDGPRIYRTISSFPSDDKSSLQALGAFASRVVSGGPCMYLSTDDARSLGLFDLRMQFCMHVCTVSFMMI